MTTTLESYLESIRSGLRLGPAEEREVISELRTHIEDSLQELKETGLSEEQAAGACLRLLGSARMIARQIYEAHSQGTWQQALLAAMPHLLFGALFALNWWNHTFWLTVTLILISAAVGYGLWRSKPQWIFPWLGYSLLPVVIVGILLMHLPRTWFWVTIPLYFLIALWWLHNTVLQAMKRDWLLASLMLLPAPIIVGWVLAVEPDFTFDEFSSARVYHFAPFIALSFLALGLTIAAFIRLRQRWLRLATLMLSGPLILTMVAYYAQGRLSLYAFLILFLALGGLFAIPALLDRRIRRATKRVRAFTGIWR